MKLEELKTHILTQLGYPLVEVELGDTHLESAIQSALDDIKPWMTVKRYFTTSVSQCIDMSELKVLTVCGVLKVDPSNSSTSSNLQSSSDDNLFYYAPTYLTSSKYTYYYSGCGFRVTLGDNLSYRREALYDALEQALAQRTAGLLKDNISFRFYEGKLYLDIGTPSASIVTVEYLVNPEVVDDITDDEYVLILKELSLAYAQRILSRIRGKFSVSGSPSNNDAENMRSDASSEIERLKAQLRSICNYTIFMTD